MSGRRLQSRSSDTNIDSHATVSGSTTLSYAQTSSDDGRPSSDITEETRQNNSTTLCVSSTVSSTTLLAPELPDPEPPVEGKTSTQSIPVYGSRKERRVLSSWWWWWEIGAVLLNITCMCLVVATLLSIDGKLLSNWHLKISPNAVIAVLTTVGKTALLVPVAECISQLKWLHFDRPNPLSDLQSFDEASRGAWGALKFIWQKRGASLFASIGCIITVMSLAFEPTAQQILDFPSRTVQAIDDTASIGVASQFEMPWNEHLQNPILNGIRDRSPEFKAPTTPIQLAVLAGLTGGTTALATSCSTPYCRFGDVTTLGLCANCEDLTYKLTRNCTHYPSKYRINGTYHGNDQWTCSFMTDEPSPRKLGNMTFYESDSYNIQPLMHVRARMAHPSNLYKNKCGGFATLRRRSDEDPEWNDDYTYLRSAKASNPTAELVEAHTCSWNWCEHTITNLSIVNGELHNSGISETPLSRVQEAETPWYEETNWYEEDFWVGEYKLATNDSLPQRVYKINWRSEIAVFAYLTTLMHKDLFVSVNEGQPDPIIQVLQRQDIQKTAHNVALSLSNALRNPANANATTHYGIALRQEAFVHVRWIWLAVPITLTVASAALLVICIILSDASPTPILKSSALATLFHGAVGFSGDDLVPSTFEDSTALTVKTKSLKAQLRRSSNGVSKLEKVD